MRMTLFKELRWLLATFLLNWAFRLTQREASREVLVAFRTLIARFRNDKRVEVNPPITRVLTCEHDPGVGDGFICPHGCNK